MAGDISGSKWWVVPAIVGPVWALAMIGGSLLVLFPESSELVTAGQLISTPAVVVLVIAAPASLLAFHKDAALLADAGSEWAPNPWHWTLLGLFLTPVVAAVGYTIDRHRNCGIPWRDVVGGNRLR